MKERYLPLENLGVTLVEEPKKEALRETLGERTEFFGLDRLDLDSGERTVQDTQTAVSVILNRNQSLPTVQERGVDFPLLQLAMRTAAEAGRLDVIKELGTQVTDAGERMIMVRGLFDYTTETNLTRGVYDAAFTAFPELLNSTELLEDSIVMQLALSDAAYNKHLYVLDSALSHIQDGAKIQSLHDRLGKLISAQQGDVEATQRAQQHLQERWQPVMELIQKHLRELGLGEKQAAMLVQQQQTEAPAPKVSKFPSSSPDSLAQTLPNRINALHLNEEDAAHVAHKILQIESAQPTISERGVEVPTLRFALRTAAEAGRLDVIAALGEAVKEPSRRLQMLRGMFDDANETDLSREAYDAAFAAFSDVLNTPYYGNDRTVLFLAMYEAAGGRTDALESALAHGANPLKEVASSAWVRDRPITYSVEKVTGLHSRIVADTNTSFHLRPPTTALAFAESNIGSTEGLTGDALEGRKTINAHWEPVVSLLKEAIDAHGYEPEPIIVRDR